MFFSTTPTTVHCVLLLGYDWPIAVISGDCVLVTCPPPPNSTRPPVHDAVAAAIVPAVGLAPLVRLALTIVGAMRAPEIVPVERLLAFRLVRFAPLPVNEFPALLNVNALP